MKTNTAPMEMPEVDSGAEDGLRRAQAMALICMAVYGLCLGLIIGFVIGRYVG